MKNKIYQKPKIIVIVGPTASGKSNLAIKLAKKYNGEIISADSRQVYKGMNIGTGKVKKDISQKSHDRVDFAMGHYSSGIRHHLIDVVNPKKQFTVNDFKKLGEKAIQDILKRGKLPIIVGGTGLYVDTLVYNRQYPAVPPNKKLRTKLEKQTPKQLFAKLKKLDPERAKIIESKNKRRLIRALEIIGTTGKPVSKLDTSRQSLVAKYSIQWIGIDPPKEELAKRIKTRLEKRLKEGMVSEVKKLRSHGLSWKRLESFGLEYKWIAQFLQNKITRLQIETGLLRDITRYSKRQMIWFKRNKEIKWMKKL